MYYDAEGKCFVAADGYVIVVHPVPDVPESESGMVSTEYVTLERKFARKKKERPGVKFDGDCVQLVQADLSGSQVEGKFPDYQKILEDAHEPGDEGTVTIGLDAKKLYRLAQALQKTGKHESLNMIITIVTGESHEPSQAMTVRPVDCGKDGPMGLLMPLYLDSSELG